MSKAMCTSGFTGRIRLFELFDCIDYADSPDSVRIAYSAFWPESFTMYTLHVFIYCMNNK